MGAIILYFMLCNLYGVYKFCVPIEKIKTETIFEDTVVMTMSVEDAKLYNILNWEETESEFPPLTDAEKEMVELGIWYIRHGEFKLYDR